MTIIIFAIMIFGAIFPVVGFVAYAHDGIVARKIKHSTGFQFNLGFKPVLAKQSCNVLSSATIRELKAIAAANNVTPITQSLYGVRYSRCNANQLRTALTCHYGI